MDDSENTGMARAGKGFGLWGLILLGGVLILIEVAVLVGPLVLSPSYHLRRLVIENAGFWPGLLYDWVPNYAGQPLAMFLTYGFLHAGPIHLLVNLITLWSLGRGVIGRTGIAKFFALYLASLVGGAAVYAVLATGAQPMVGASGALFGLAGAVLAWEYLDRFSGALSLWPVGRAVVLLLVLNVVLWWAMDGVLAWQTHLGGFIAGWLMAMLLDPTARSA